MSLSYSDREKLISRVILQIQTDMYEGDYEALYELLEIIEPKYLLSFLAEAAHHEKMRWH